jgi:hypothetical protein
MMNEIMARGPITCSIAAPDVFDYGYHSGVSVGGRGGGGVHTTKRRRNACPMWCPKAAKCLSHVVPKGSEMPVPCGARRRRNACPMWCPNLETPCCRVCPGCETASQGLGCSWAVHARTLVNSTVQQLTVDML